MGGCMKEKKTTKIHSFNLDIELIKTIKIVAVELDISMGELVERALQNYLTDLKVIRKTLKKNE
jgi:hypothetical protein